MPYQSIFSSSGSGSTPASSGRSGVGYQHITADQVASIAPQQDSSNSGLTNINALKTKNQQQQKNNNKSAGRQAVDDIGGFLSGAGHVAKSTGRALVRPLADQVQADIVDPTKSLTAQATGNKKAQANADKNQIANQGKTVHDLSQLTSDVSGGSVNQLAAAVKQLPKGIAADVAAGSSNPNTRAAGVKAQQEAQKAAFGTTDSGTIAKKIIGSTVGTAALIVGAPEVGAAKTAVVSGGEAAAKVGAKDAAEQAAKSTAAKLAPRVAKDAAIGATGTAASDITQNPNESTKKLIEHAVVGGVTAGTLPIVAAAAGKGVQYLFGKKPEAPTTPTPIEVVDKSTGTTKGTVTNVLPKSTGADVTPSPSVRPSSAGYTDAEFRAEFNSPAAQVAKNTPEVVNAFTKTGSHDPTTLTIATLADATNAKKVGGIVDQMVPGLQGADRTATVKAITAAKDPAEVSHLLYDAAHNQHMTENAATHLTGTPMDKSISFNNPSDAENAQRQQLHVRVTQINKAIDSHAAGTTEQTPEALNALLKSRQTAQDVLAGKTTYDAAYGAKVNPSAIKPLPFVGEPVAGHPLEQTKGIVANIPKVAEGDSTRQAVVNREVAMRNTLDTFHAAQATETWNKLSKEDQALFNKSETPAGMTDKQGMNRFIRIAKANGKDPEALIKYAKIHAMDMQTVLAHRQALHPETANLPNYRPHLYDTGDKATQDYLAKRSDQYALAIKNGKPGYTQHRVIPTYAEAEKILGPDGQPLLKRANANAHEDYIQTLQRTAGENGQAALVQGLRDAHGTSSVFHVGTSPTGDNLGNLRISGSKGLSMPQELADHYNARETAGPSKNMFVRAYDKVNKGVKNTVLAGGAFHGLQSGLTVAGQQLISGVRHPSYLVDNLRLVGDSMSSKLRDAHLEAMKNNAGDFKDGMNSLERQRAAGLTYTDLATKATDGKSQGLLNKLPGFKQLHEAVFERQLPAAKQMIFDQKTAHLDLRNPADLAKARSEASGINYMIGGIDSATAGLSPKAMQKFSRVVLAADYTEGRAMTVANAITKWGADNPAGRTARQAVIGKSLVTAIPGLVALAATGKLNPKDPKAVGDAFLQQIVSPQIPTPWRSGPSKSSPNGNPISLKLPSTYISEIGKVLAPAIDPGSTYDNSRTSGLKDFASARLAALPGAIEKLSTNKDYFGNPIITGDKKQSALNVAEQFAPIPISQGAKAAGGKQNLAETALNVAGFRASSSTLPADTAHSRRLNEFYNTKNALETNRGKVVKQMNDLVRSGNTNQADRLAAQFNTTIDAQTKGFRSKYASNYNPAYDTEFLKAKISPTNQANKARVKAIKQSDAVLQ